MNLRKKIGIQKWINFLLVIAVIAVINLIASNLFFRFDLTENNIYSLSDGTKNILQNLDDRVTVTVYFSEDLPAQYAEFSNIIRNKLDEYKVYAGEKLQYEFVDPSDSASQIRASSDGVPMIRLNVFEDDKYTSRTAFAGMVITYKGRKAVLPTIMELSWLEYELTRAITKVLHEESYIGYVVSHGTPDMQRDVRLAISALASRYRITQVDLTAGAIPSDIKVLILLKPDQHFENQELMALDNFLAAGGSLALFYDKIHIDLETGEAFPLNLGLEELLDHYGIRVNTDIVLDAKHAEVVVPQQQGSQMYYTRESFPFIPIITDFDRTNHAVKDLESINLIAASSIDTTRLVNSSNKWSVLARSSEKAYLMRDGFLMVAGIELTDDMINAARVPLAAFVAGTFTSMFNALPESIAANANRETKIFVVGDGDFILDKYLGQTGIQNPNLVFFQNIIDMLTLEDGLIYIRSREITYRPLRITKDGKSYPFTKQQKTQIKLMNLILPLILLFALGIVNFFFLGWRAKKRNNR